MTSDFKDELRKIKDAPSNNSNHKIEVQDESYGLLFSIAGELSELLQMQLELSLQHFASDMPGQFKSGLTLLTKTKKNPVH